MAWETRNNKGKYYTRSVRLGGRIIREYVGSGAVAQAEAEADAQARHQREQARQADRAVQARWETQETITREFSAAVEALLRQMLRRAGYHRHHGGGEWRKRRQTQDMTSKDMAIQEQAIRAARVPETQDERSEFLSRALGGDQAAVPMALAILRRYPKELILNVSSPRQALVELWATGPMPRQLIANEYDARLAAVAGPDATPLELVLVERVVVSQMQVSKFEREYTRNIENTIGTSMADFMERRLDRAHKRLLSAVKTLAQVRRLQVPLAVQINVAEKQINIAP